MVCRQEPHSSLQGTRRADVFAEGRKGNVISQPVPQGQGDHEHRQHDIFQPGQRPGDRGLPELRRRDFVEQLLDPSKGTDPSADGPPEDDAVQQEDSQDIPSSPVACGGQGILQRTQRAGAHGARAGIAVEARNAGRFSLPPVNIPGDKALQVRVIQSSAVYLDQPPGCRAVALPPGSFSDLIQGRYTPYRY